MTVDHVHSTLSQIGVKVSPDDAADYTKLLAAVSGAKCRPQQAPWSSGRLYSLIILCLVP